MNALTSLFQSTIGKKVLMGATGLVMVGWLFLHMSGNMLVFAGQDSFNHYAHFIQSGFGVEPALLWVMRLGMLAMIVGHVWAAIALTRLNKAHARPEPYVAGRKNRVTSYAALFMSYGGIVILAYLLFHLAHLTVGVMSDTAAMPVRFDAHDAYANLVMGVGVPWVGFLYVLANLAVGAHLYHGIQSGFQTLGANGPKWDVIKTQASFWVPLAIAGGNTVIALACMFGVGTIVTPPDPTWTSPY